MARRRKAQSIDIQIEQLKNDIVEAEKELKEMKKNLKELEEMKKQKDVEELYTLMSEKGKSIEDIKSLLME